MTALALPWPFDRQYMQLALVAGVAVGAAAPTVGAFLVQKRLSLLGDGIGHVAFLGVSAGLLLRVWPFWTALAAAVAGALLIEWVRSRSAASGDLALAAVFYGGIGGGVVLSSAAGALDASVLSYLFGSLLTVTTGETAAVVLLGAAVVAAVLATRRALFAVVLDEEAARVAGVPVDTLNLGLAALAAVTVVAAMRVVGLLLVAALMVLPVGTARSVARSFAGTLSVSVAVGMASVIVGLVIARAAGLAPGGVIVVVAAASYVVAAVSGRATGR